MGIEPTSEAWELSETATYAPVSVRTNMSIRKERIGCGTENSYMALKCMSCRNWE